MSAVFLAAPVAPSPPPVRTARVQLVLESLDGSRRLPLDSSAGWKALAGARGLALPPMQILTSSAPGVAGSVLTEVRVEERPVFLPLLVKAADRNFATHRAMLDTLAELVDPTLGEFRIVAITARGVRELQVVYTGGLEGATGRDEAGLYWAKLGLTAVACQPFAQDRADRFVEFAMSGETVAFLGAAGGTDAPWPRALSSSAVIGDNMRVVVGSDVPVYPVIELVGPMDSFTGTVELEDTTLPPYFGGSEWSVSIPNGVPAGSTLRLVTDPRAKSIRMDGQRAAGRVARGSTLSPFYPGGNVMSVAAPGGDEDTRIRISWRERRRSLW